MPEDVLIPYQDVHEQPYMQQLTRTWMLYCDPGSGGGVKVNGRTVQTVFSGDEVADLKVSSGAQCGLHTACPCVNTWGNLIGQYYYSDCYSIVRNSGKVSRNRA